MRIDAAQIDAISQFSFSCNVNTMRNKELWFQVRLLSNKLRENHSISDGELTSVQIHFSLDTINFNMSYLNQEAWFAYRFLLRLAHCSLNTKSIDNSIWSILLTKKRLSSNFVTPPVLSFPSPISWNLTTVLGIHQQ